jgi:hypothetical protein
LFTGEFVAITAARASIVGPFSVRIRAGDPSEKSTALVNGKQLRTVSLNGCNYTTEIFEDMKLALIGKTEAGAGRK